EEPALAFAPDHRGLVAAGGGLAADRAKAVGLERVGLALCLDRLRGLAVDRLADETAGLLAQEDLAGLGRLLEASSHIDGVPGCQALLGAGHDLAGVDADAQLEARSVRALELIVEVAEAGAQLVGGSHGPERVILVHRRHPEDGHDRVADELLDGAAVPLDDRLRGLEVARHHAAKALGVDPLAERGRAGDVAEQGVDDLPRFAGRRGPGQRRAARVAEARAFTVLRPTARADEHGASVTSRNAGDLRARSRQPLGPRTGALIHERGAAPARLARPLRGAPLARRD